MTTEFSAKYTQANLATSAAAYSSDQFGRWRSRLDEAFSTSIAGLSGAILSAMLCAQRRGDAVGPLFQDATRGRSEEEIKEAFALFREAVTVIFPFVGLPNCMPASFALIAELKKLGIQGVDEQARPSFSQVDYVAKGHETSEKIYHGVGNEEVRVMIAQFFPDLSYVTGASVFGYVLGGSSLLSLRETESLVAAAVTALGATRQARSHLKAALQLGNTEEALQAIVDVAIELSTWSQSPSPQYIEVAQLRAELNTTLATGH